MHLSLQTGTSVRDSCLQTNVGPQNMVVHVLLVYPLNFGRGACRALTCQFIQEQDTGSKAV